MYEKYSSRSASFEMHMTKANTSPKTMLVTATAINSFTFVAVKFVISIKNQCAVLLTGCQDYCCQFCWSYLSLSLRNLGQYTLILPI